MRVTLPGKAQIQVEIDACDWSFVSKFTWGLDKNGYAYTQVWTKRLHRPRRIMLHDLIVGIPKKSKYEIDHIDRNKLNNMLCNLRSVPQQINIINRNLNRNNSTGLKGVSLVKRDNLYRASINVGSTGFNLGHYATKSEAAKVYNNIAQEWHGPYAILNDLTSIKD